MSLFRFSPVTRMFSVGITQQFTTFQGLLLGGGKSISLFSKSDFKLPTTLLTTSRRYLSTAATTTTKTTTTTAAASSRNINANSSFVADTSTGETTVKKVMGTARRFRRLTADNRGQGGLYRCTAYCTAGGYNADQLLDSLSKRRLSTTIYSNDIIHTDFAEIATDATAKAQDDLPSQGEAFFFFKDGCVILWNTDEAQDKSVLEMLRPFEIDRVSEIESEDMDFMYGSVAGMRGDTMVLSEIEEDSTTITAAAKSNNINNNKSNSSSNVMEKIAFSYGMQRSVKLAVIENMVDKVIEGMKHVPHELIVKRKLNMSSSAVMYRMGQLLYLRASLNMNSPLSETPEMYWEQPEFEQLYDQISKQLDVKSRISATNSKIDYSQELVEVLRTHMHEKTGTNMEIAIIVLIAVEVIFELMHWMGFKTVGEKEH